MKKCLWLAGVVFFVFADELMAQSAGPARFGKAALASVHPLATQAGLNAIQAGGNAVDAAIATALTLGVVDGHNSGIGGGCFILVHAPDGSITCIDGREMAPAKAHRDLYIINGKLDEEASKTGALAVAVPGALAAYDLALKKHGKLKLADLLRPAADIAEKGFPLDEVYDRKLKATAEKIAKFPESAAILLKADGSALKKGDVLMQKDLATTLRAIADQGLDWFYRGDFARRTAEWMTAQGGIVTAEDFANYVAKEREPLRTRYRGHEIIGMPPPSSGGIHVAQILTLIEPFPVRHLRTASRVHLITEAMKLAFADRAFWLGDPDFAKVPTGLLSTSYLDQQRAKLSLDKLTPVPQHGVPEKAHDEVFGKHTTHLSTADAEGYWVALTQTINTAFGSKVIIPGTGVIMNNEMDDFSAQPGVPNAFKLVGAENNAVAAGKRPLSSMSPTLVLREGKPFMTVGAAGGPTIITQTLLAITNVIDDGMSATEALAAPRFHHQWNPDELRIESRFGKEALDALHAYGHKLDDIASFGACQCITLDPSGELLEPAHDPRVPGSANGL